MEPFSAAAAAVTLCPIVIGITRELRNAYKSVKYARRELEELVTEMDIFTDHYSEFLKACSTRKKHRKRVWSAKTKLVSWAQRAILDFRELLDKVDALARDPTYSHTVMETAFAHYKWYFSKNHLGHLRASLSVARQSMVGFTNICNIELLDEQLAHLKSVVTPQQRQEIEKEYGMTKEQRAEELQGMRDTCELQQSELPHRLKEASERVKVYQKQTKDDEVIQQTLQLQQFSESVNRYVHRVLPADKAGRRPPRPSRPSSHGSRRHRHDSFLTSQSTATTSTESTQPSHRQTPTPESPPTSLEPSTAESAIELQPDKEEAISILNFCQRCSGTCTNIEVHNTSIRQPSPDPRSHTMGYIPNTTPGPFSMQTNEATGSSASSRPWMSREYQTQPSSSEEIPASDSYPNTHQRHPPQPSVEPANEAREIPHIDLATPEGDEDDFQDGAPEQESSTEKQATGSKSSIWKATGGFEGDMPKDLRKRRQRSRSPQDFW